MDTDLAAVLRRAEDAVRRARRNLEEARATLACAGARVAREKRLMSECGTTDTRSATAPAAEPDAGPAMQ